MNILCLGIGFFVGSIFGVLLLSLCVAAKMGNEKEMSMYKNFHLTESRQQGTDHGNIPQT